MKHASRVKIVGRRIDLLHTDVAATFRRVRAEQARNAREREQKVSQIDKKTKAA